MLCDALSKHPEIDCRYNIVSKDRNGNLDIDELIKSICDEYLEQGGEFPEFLGLHGYFENLTDDAHLRQNPKIHLFRKDLTRGSVRQCLGNTERVDRGFDLDPTFVSYAKRLRDKRDKELRIYTTKSFNVESLRKIDGETFKWRKSRSILNQIGASKNFRLASDVEIDSFEPRNMMELYDA